MTRNMRRTRYLSERCPQATDIRMTALLYRVAATATSAHDPCRVIRIRSGSTTPNPEAAALIGMNARSHGRARNRLGQVRRERAISKLSAKRGLLKPPSFEWRRRSVKEFAEKARPLVPRHAY